MSDLSHLGTLPGGEAALRSSLTTLAARSFALGAWPYLDVPSDGLGLASSASPARYTWSLAEKANPSKGSNAGATLKL